MTTPVSERDRLAPCPGKPNCVSSQAADAKHAVPPLSFRGDAGSAMRRFRAVVEAMPRARVVSATDQRLSAEFRSRLLGFVDDLDALLDAEAGVIHVRSASRIGYSDFGVNRNRVAAIRAAFERQEQGSMP